MEWIAAHCSAWEFAQNGLFVSLLLAGLVGSLTHCSTMCGPMVISQMLNPTYHRSGVSPQMQLLAYHAGRLSTYSAMGLIAGLAGSWLFGNALFSTFTGAALFVAGVVFLHSALWPSLPKSCECNITRRISQIMHSLKAPAFLKGYLRGMLLGFMPCGLVMAALLLVTTTGNPLLSASGMLVFGLGTAPLLQAIGLGAYRLFSSKNRFHHYFGKSMMTLNGFVLCGLGIHQL